MIVTTKTLLMSFHSEMENLKSYGIFNLTKNSYSILNNRFKQQIAYILLTNKMKAFNKLMALPMKFVSAKFGQT
jgi:hypothetical protein